MQEVLNELLNSLVSLALLPRPSERTQLELIDAIQTKFEDLLHPELRDRASEVSAYLSAAVRDALRPFLAARATSSEEVYALATSALRQVASELHIKIDVPAVLPTTALERESIGRSNHSGGPSGDDHGRSKDEIIADLREQLRQALRSEAALKAENARLRETVRTDRSLNEELARKLEVLAVLHSDPTDGGGMASIGYTGLPGTQSPNGQERTSPGGLSPSASFNRHIPIVISAGGAHPAPPRGERGGPSRQASMNTGHKPKLVISARDGLPPVGDGELPPLSPGNSEPEHEPRHERSSSDCDGGDEAAAAHAPRPKQPVLRRLSSGAVRLEPPPPELDPEVDPRRLSARTDEDEEDDGSPSGQRGSKRRELAAALLSAKLYDRQTGAEAPPAARVTRRSSTGGSGIAAVVRSPSGRRTTELAVTMDGEPSPSGGHASADEVGSAASARRRAQNEALRIAVAEGLRAGFSTQGSGSARGEGPPSPRISSLSPPGSSRTTLPPSVSPVLPPPTPAHSSMNLTGGTLDPAGAGALYGADARFGPAMGLHGPAAVLPPSLAAAALARTRSPAPPHAPGGADSPTGDSLRRIEEKLAQRGSPPVEPGRVGSPTNAPGAPPAAAGRASDVFRVPSSRPQPLNVHGAPQPSPVLRTVLNE